MSFTITSVCGHYEMIRPSGDVTREAVLYLYIAASLFRLLNYVRSWFSIINGFSRFYGETVNVRVPVPSEDAVQLLKYWLDLEIRAKVTFGMHIVSIVMQLSEALNCSMGLIVDFTEAKEVEKQVECLVHVFRFRDGNDVNYRRGMWRSEEPVKHKGILQIAQLAGSVSEDNKRKCVIVAQRLLEMLKSQVYASFGCIEDARKVFDGMCVRDVAVWNAMVSGYCKVGEFEKARELFEVMEERNVVSWTALIAGYAQGNRACEAVEVFRRMRVDGVKPDEVTMVALLSACAQLGALELGEWVHGYIDEYNLRKSMSLNNALIDMYAKSGNIKKAMDVFENMKDQCVITWTTVIAGLALHGLGKEALDIFSRMEKSRVKPNDVTLIAVLSACSHSGLVKSGRWYFNNLLKKYGIKPRIEHYGCMIDLLDRAGCLLEAQEVLKKMPFEANAAIWGSLLAALYKNVDLGKKALDHLVKLEPYNSGNFLLLSNLYAANGHWNESGSIRKAMRDNGVKKIFGVSCIEVNSRVHEFISGNGSHPLLIRSIVLVK
ncbi:pentatricopeptide repeat-containing protein [Tanacetum coccineum]